MRGVLRTKSAPTRKSRKGGVETAVRLPERARVTSLDDVTNGDRFASHLERAWSKLETEGHLMEDERLPSLAAAESMAVPLAGQERVLQMAPEGLEAHPVIPQFPDEFVRPRWESCDMSLKALTNPRQVARGPEQLAPVKRPRTGCSRPGPDTEEVTLDAPEP
jgi:hypothetical protein